MHVPDHGTHHLVKFRAEMTSWPPCTKMTNFWQEMRSKNLNFWQEICHFCTGRIRCHFGVKFHTVVRTMVRYVHDCFRNFLKSFQIFLCSRKYQFPDIYSFVTSSTTILYMYSCVIFFNNYNVFVDCWRLMEPMLNCRLSKANWFCAAPFFMFQFNSSCPIGVLIRKNLITCFLID